MRLPLVDVSCIDFTFKTTLPTSYDKICNVMEDAANGPQEVIFINKSRDI
jgi:glyceraldehyde-3-phosphate dehydrogenase/erythrose-4-phosphate dehydrogenase